MLWLVEKWHSYSCLLEGGDDARPFIWVVCCSYSVCAQLCLKSWFCLLPPWSQRNLLMLMFCAIFRFSRRLALSSKDGRVEGCVLIFCENTKIVTSCWQDNVVSHQKKDILCPRSKHKPQQDGRRGSIAFKIKCHTHQICSEGTNKTLVWPGPRERSHDLHKRLSQTCLWLSVSCRGMGQKWPVSGAGALAAAVLGGIACWHKYSWSSPLALLQSHWADDPKTGEQLYQRSSHTVAKSSRAHKRFLILGTQLRDWEPTGNLTLQASGVWLQNFHRTRERETLGGLKQNLVLTRAQEKVAVTSTRTEPDLPVRAQASPAEAWVSNDLPRGQRHWLRRSWEVQHAGVSRSDGGCHYHHCTYQSLASGQTTRRKHSPTHQKKIGLKIYWAWPCPPD